MTIECRMCHQKIEVEVSSEELASWKGGKLIQYAMPYVPPEIRELFISGTCGDCWNRLFSGEEF